MASQLFMDNSRHSSLGLGSEAAQSCNEDRIKISPETVRSSGNTSIETASKSVLHRITLKLSETEHPRMKAVSSSTRIKSINGSSKLQHYASSST